MVMQSNVIVCWRDLRQRCRDERRIRMASCADVISGNLIASCPMHSNAKVCWCGSLRRIVCGQASERQRVPGDLRQADPVVPVHRCIGPAAQPARAVDAATRPQDRCDFEIWIRSEAHLVLLRRRG